MKRFVAYVLAPVATALLMAAPANAVDPKSRKPADPNEMVCEKQTVLGSRLATKRVCLTRAEWAERRRLDRQDLDKAQQSRSLRAD